MPALPNEYTQVEFTLIEQLKQMDWPHLAGSTENSAVTGRTSFREVLLQDHLRAALRRINRGPGGEEWLDESRCSQAISTLERIPALKLMEANEKATALLLTGTQVEGLRGWDEGRDQTIHYIDWTHWGR